MSKFVGETEQNMAAHVRARREAEKAVLLLDEADSFLRDRRGAQRTYEVTEVNEMLQGMERFAGIFVCTTNLIDAHRPGGAAPLHLQDPFKPLTARAARAHVRRRGAGGRRERAHAPRSARAAGAAGRSSCPGDFAAVKRQVDILARRVLGRRVPRPARSRAPHQARSARSRAASASSNNTNMTAAPDPARAGDS